MSTNFPSSLDTSVTLPAESASTPLSTNHVTAHQNIQDALEAVEAKIGVDSSAVTTSHDYKLGEVTSTDKAVGKTASQTLTNKTLTAPVITSPTINLTSDAEGDTYYRNAAGAFVRLPKGTDNYIYKMNGNVPNWEAEAVISNATSSSVGIVELATAAEITAGTASGSVGPLAITPDQLALSTPVFNGSGLTNLVASRYLAVQTSDVSLSSSSTETDIIANTNVPGGILTTGRAIRVKMFVELTENNTSGDITFRLYYGGSSVASITHVGSSTVQYGEVEFIMAYNGASAQYISSRINTIVNTTAAANGIMSLTQSTTAAVSSGSNQNVKITVQGSAVNTPTAIKVYGAIIEVI